MGVFLFYMKKSNKIIIIILVSLLIILEIFFVVSKKMSKENLPPVSQNQVQTAKAILEIENIKYEEGITGTETVYSLMDKLKQEGKINFKETNYIGMGELITEINGIQASGGKSWIYYVNGKQANVGVSNYKLKNGDIVSWQYQTYDEKNIY